MWRKSKPLENGDHNALIFDFILGGRDDRELNFYIQRPTIQGRKEGREGKRRKQKKNISLYLNKLT